MQIELKQHAYMQVFGNRPLINKGYWRCRQGFLRFVSLSDVSKFFSVFLKFEVLEEFKMKNKYSHGEIKPII